MSDNLKVKITPAWRTDEWYAPRKIRRGFDITITPPAGKKAKRKRACSYVTRQFLGRLGLKTPKAGEVLTFELKTAKKPSKNTLEVARGYWGGGGTRHSARLLFRTSKDMLTFYEKVGSISRSIPGIPKGSHNFAPFKKVNARYKKVKS